jgi:hypothetical protein
VLEQAFHVPDPQVSDVHVQQDPLRAGDVGVPVGDHAEFGITDLQAHNESRAFLWDAGDLRGAEQRLVEGSRGRLGVTMTG